MKRYAVLVVAIASLFAVTATAAAADTKPFVGYAAGESSWYTNPLNCPGESGTPADGATTVTEATGVMTRFGRVDVTMWHCPTPDATMDGTIFLTARNGDQLIGTYVGDADFDPFAPIGSWFDGEATIEVTSGTGKFEGVTATATLTVSLRYDGFLDPEWPFIGQWDGWIDR